MANIGKITQVIGPVVDVAFDVFTNWHGDRYSHICNLHATDKTFGTIHCNGADTVLTKMLLALQHYFSTIVLGNFKRIKDVR